MPAEQWVAVGVGSAAVVALLAVVVLAVALRRTREQLDRTERRVADVVGSSGGSSGPAAEPQSGSGADAPAPTVVPVLTDVPAHRPTAEDRTVVAPTQEEVVHATMGRALVRGAVLSHGLWYALRPDSRDRVRALVRREYRRRRKVRLRAGRRAARHAPVSPARAQAWLGSGTPPREGREGWR